MKIAAVGKKRNLVGLGLAGIAERIETDDPEDAFKHVSDFVISDDYGIIIITSEIYKQIADRIEILRERRRIPIFFEMEETKVGGKT